jgi:uncharacterized membrane protein
MLEAQDSEEAGHRTPGGPVVHGLILLAFLAALVVVIAVRLRRRLGLATHPRTWVVIFGVFVVVVLVLWGQAQH